MPPSRLGLVLGLKQTPGTAWADLVAVPACRSASVPCVGTGNESKDGLAAVHNAVESAQVSCRSGSCPCKPQLRDCVRNPSFSRLSPFDACPPHRGHGRSLNQSGRFGRVTGNGSQRYQNRWTARTCTSDDPWSESETNHWRWLPGWMQKTIYYQYSKVPSHNTDKD
jgi:hypothetical protein